MPVPGPPPGVRERRSGHHAASRGANQRVRIGAAHAEGAGAGGGREARRGGRGRALARHGRAQAAARAPVAQRGGHVRVEAPQAQDGRAGALVQRGGRHENACRPVQAQGASLGTRFNLVCVLNQELPGRYAASSHLLTLSKVYIQLHTWTIGPSALCNAPLQQCPSMSACVLCCFTCDAGGALGVAIAGLCAVHGEHPCRGSIGTAVGEGLAQRAHLDGVPKRRACAKRGACNARRDLRWCMSRARACGLHKH